MSVIIRLIEQKNNELVEFSAKKERRDNLALELAIVDKEIAEFDKEQVVKDIDELTECAIKLGLVNIQDDTQESVAVDTE
jgi:hypothetical protein